MHLSLGLPSHLLSLTIPKQQYKKQQQKTAGTNHKTFLNEKSTCRMEPPEKTTKLDGNDTTTLHTIPTSCAIQVTNYAQHKTPHARSLFICAKCSIAHSAVFYRYISTMFSSNKISEHNLNFNVPYTMHTMQADPTLLMDSSFCIQARQTRSAMLNIASTLYIAATLNITHSLCTSTCTPNTTHHIAFHNPLHTTNKHTKHICVSGGKMAQDVGMM